MNQTPQEEHKDPTWDLLNNASEQKAGPMFSRDVMRAVRLAQDTPQAWWKTLLQPKSLIGITAVAACALLVLPTVFYRTQTPIENTPLAKAATSPILEEAQQTNDLDGLDLALDDEILVTEMLIAFIEEPEAFADEETFNMIGL